MDCLRGVCKAAKRKILKKKEKKAVKSDVIKHVLNTSTVTTAAEETSKSVMGSMRISNHLGSGHLTLIYILM